MTRSSSDPLDFLSPRRRRRLVEVSRELEHRSPREAGTLGFYPRLLILASLPYRPVEAKSYTRQAGHFRLVVEGTERLGLPYGRYPRLVLAWVATEAVRTRRCRVEFGPSFSGFLRQLGVGASGGRHGPMHRIQDQMERLFKSMIFAEWAAGPGRWDDGFRVSCRSSLWLEHNGSKASTLTESFVVLSTKFLEELLKAPVPVDLRVFEALLSPLALDLYCWLRFRLFRRRRPLVIPWPSLYQQFGTQTPRPSEFRRSFHQALAQVVFLCPGLRVGAHADGLHLWRSPTAFDSPPRTR